MTAWRWAGSLMVVAGCFLCTSCFSSDEDVTLQGAGATFPAPLYKRWFREYYKAHPNVRTNYQPIGSGAGLRQFNEGLLHFGASDAFEQPKVAGGGYLIPMTAGGIAVCYNLPGASAEVRLSRAVYTNIFLGKITEWDDPAIARDNPGVRMPSLPITVARRSDGSGTTFAFTNHLNAVSKEWRKEAGGPGKGKSVVWPTGLGGRGNSGVAAIIQQTPGAIGYLEFGYAELAHIPMAHLQNKAGKFVAATAEHGLAALSGPNEKRIPDDLHIEIPDPEGDDAYPIVTYTWILTYRKYEKTKVGEAIKDVLRYCLTDGQEISAELGYLPLPNRVAEKSLALVEKIEFGK